MGYSIPFGSMLPVEAVHYTFIILFDFDLFGNPAYGCRTVIFVIRGFEHFCIDPEFLTLCSNLISNSRQVF